MDEELERFKNEIDLVAYAGSLGFELSKKSSKREAVMKRGAETLVITKDDDGHYIYFSPTDDHAGTIIDLAQRHVEQNFGAIRKALRKELGIERPAPVHRLEKTPKDLQGVLREWHAASEYLSHDWLENTRKIPRSLILSPRFEGKMRLDSRGNVLFMHTDITDSICGFDRKNKGFVGFSGGGEKGLACSNDFAGDERIVFCEAFVDMLSHVALFPDAKARYRSFGGGLNPKQPELMRAHILALPRGSEVIAAVDADDAGYQFAKVIESLSDGYAFRTHIPDAGDWNDVLREGSFPAARYGTEP